MKKKILIIDDEPTLLTAFNEVLSENEFLTFSANDGVEGLRIALKEKPDVILLDIKMPKMDGLTMMHKLRQDVWGSKVPIIILTNYEINDAQLGEIELDKPSYCIIKANTSISRILDLIHEVLNVQSIERSFVPKK